MCGSLIQFISEEPERISSDYLIKESHSVQQTPQGTISSELPYDLFMASSFCAYVYKKKQLEILPLLQWGNDELAKQKISEASQIISLSSSKQFLNKNNEKNTIQSVEDDNNLINKLKESDENYVSPFSFSYETSNTIEHPNSLPFYI